MPLRVQCPQGHLLSVPESRAGKTVRCPRCGTNTDVPATSKPSVTAGHVREPAKPAAVKPAPPKSAPPARKGPPPLPVKKADPETVPPPQERADEPAFPAFSARAAENAADNSVATSAPPPEPVDDAADLPTCRGYEPDGHYRATTRMFAVAFAGVALLGMAPAMVAIAQVFSREDAPGVPAWAYVTLGVSVVQFALALLLAQAPDWSSAWVAAIAALAMSAGYGMALSVTLMGGRENELVAWMQLGDLLSNHQAARWCLVMLGSTGLFTYFCGRFALLWHRAYAFIAKLEEGG